MDLRAVLQKVAISQVIIIYLQSRKIDPHPNQIREAVSKIIFEKRLLSLGM
jgi:hypothetical protein